MEMNVVCIYDVLTCICVFVFIFVFTRVLRWIQIHREGAFCICDVFTQYWRDANT